MRPRTAASLVLVSAIGVAAFGWPFLVDAGPGLAHAADAPWLFAALLPLLLVVVVAQLAEGEMDAKSVAMLGVLAAVGTGLRAGHRALVASSRSSSCSCSPGVLSARDSASCSGS